MVQFLRDRELSDGLLAPWSAWWPREDLEEVVGGHWDLLTTDEVAVVVLQLAAWLEVESCLR
jgi:thioesterase domain-containing protein